jgi:hypothetical protein
LDAPFVRRPFEYLLDLAKLMYDSLGGDRSQALIAVAGDHRAAYG